MPTTQRSSLQGVTREQFLARHRIHGHDVDARLAVCLDCELAFVDGHVVDFYDDAMR